MLDQYIRVRYIIEVNKLFKIYYNQNVIYVFYLFHQ